MEKTKTLGVALLLPILIFLLFISVSDAKNNGQVEANVRVVPAVGMKCTPNPLVLGTSDKVFTCLIEISNYVVSKIIISSLQLSVAGKPPIPVLSTSPNTVGDFDNDGKLELKVTFDKKIVDSWFSDLGMPKDFTFLLTGNINGVSDFTFAITDIIQVIKPSYTFVYFNGKGGDVTTIKGIDLTKAIITSSNIEKSGHQLISFSSSNFVKQWDDVLGTVTGETPVQITKTKSINLGFTAWVRYTGDGCTFNPYTSVVCDGKGMFYKRGLAVGYSSESVDVHFEVNGDMATLTAKEGNNIVFQQLNVPVSNFQYVIKTQSSFYLF